MKQDKPIPPYLSKREQQIMDVVYRLDKATAEEITANIPRPPSKDAVRRLIRILEEKGYLKHQKEGPRHVYIPTQKPEKIRRRALNHMIQTYFQGSATRTMAALLKSESEHLSQAEFDEILQLIQKARQEGR